MLVLPRWPATLDYHAQGVRRPHRRVRNLGRNKKCLPLTHEMIDDAIAFANTDLDVPLELVKVLFRIDQVKIVPGVWTLDHHHKKVAAVIKVTVAYRRFEFFAVLFDPSLEIDRRLHRGRVLGSSR